MVLQVKSGAALCAAGVAVALLVSIAPPASRAAFADAPGLNAAADGDACLSDWAVARDVVRRENLMTVEELAQSSPPKFNGQIVKATLCREANGYIYRLVVRDNGGRLRSLIIDAQSPVKAATPR